MEGLNIGKIQQILNGLLHLTFVRAAVPCHCRGAGGGLEVDESQPAASAASSTIERLDVFPRAPKTSIATTENRDNERPALGAMPIG